MIYINKLCILLHIRFVLNNGDERIVCKNAFVNIHGITPGKSRALSIFLLKPPLLLPVDQLVGSNLILMLQRSR